MSEKTVNPSNPQLELATGVRHTLTIAGFGVTLLEFEDVNFNFDSAVLLPAGPGGNSEAQATAGGLAALAAVLDLLRDHGDYQAIVAGHADQSGGETYNEALSLLRAESVLHLLCGERDAWVALVQSKHQVVDLQQILLWVVLTRGWPTDPGAPDGDLGPKTSGAIEAFQESYSEDFSAIAVDGIAGPQTWGAIFDLYMDSLADALGCDTDRLDAYRANLHYVDDGEPAVGCGEQYPIDPRHGPSQRSATDRRVEVLLFEPHEIPTNKSASEICDLVYREASLFRRRYIDAADDHVEAPVLTPVPATLNAGSNILMRLDAVDTKLPPRAYAVDAGADPEQGWTTDDGVIYVIPPAAAEAFSYVYLNGRRHPLSEPVVVTEDPVLAVESLSEQMTILHELSSARQTFDSGRGASDKQLQRRYRVVVDNGHERLSVALHEISEVRGPVTVAAYADAVHDLLSASRGSHEPAMLEVPR